MVRRTHGHPNRLIVALALLLALALAGVSCAADSPLAAPQSTAPTAAPARPTAAGPAPAAQPAQPAKTVKIGNVQPMSGINSAYGQETGAGFDFMIKKINAEGGIKSLGGAKIEVVLADEASDGARAADEARRLITQENVALLTGSLLSAQMATVSPVADQYKMPVYAIWPAGTRSPYLYSTGFPYDRGYAGTMVNYMDWLKKTKGRNIQNVVLASSNYEAGQQVDKFMQQRLKDLGYNVVDVVPLDQNAQDQTPAMLRIRSKKPDAVLSLITARDGILFHRARFNANYHDPVFIGGTAGYSDPVLWKELGKDVGKAVLARNAFGMTGFATGVALPALQNLLTELKAANLNIPIGQNVVQGAQGARMVQALLEEAASTDREAIFQAFKRVKIPAGSPYLYLPREGGLVFGEDRMPVDSTALIIQWTEDEVQQVVWPEKLAEKEPKLR